MLYLLEKYFQVKVRKLGTIFIEKKLPIDKKKDLFLVFEISISIIFFLARAFSAQISNNENQQPNSEKTAENIGKPVGYNMKL